MSIKVIYRNLNRKDAKAVSRLACLELCHTDPLYRYMCMTEADILPFFRVYIKAIISHKLSIGAFDRKTGRLYGFVLCSHVNKQLHRDVIDGLNPIKLNRILRIMDMIKDLGKGSEEAKLVESSVLVELAVSERCLSDTPVDRELCLRVHQKARNLGKAVLSVATAFDSQALLRLGNGRVLKSISYRKYEDKDGTSPFKEMPEPDVNIEFWVLSDVGLGKPSSP
ncbi:uncharacterized protein LOC100176282 [Ciona intestinalis]